MGQPEYWALERVLADRAVPGSVEFVRGLEESCYERVYVAARPERTRHATEEWLETQGFPWGHLFLADEHKGRLALAEEMRRAAILVAGVGSTWQDNDLHHELECASVTVAPHGGDWPGARERIRFVGTEVSDPRARDARYAMAAFVRGLIENRFVRRDNERMRQAVQEYVHSMGTSQVMHRDVAGEGMTLSLVLGMWNRPLPEEVRYEIDVMLEALTNRRWKERLAEIEDCM